MLLWPAPCVVARARFLRKEEGKIQFKCQVSVNLYSKLLKFTVNFHGETDSHLVKLNVCLDQLLLALWN